MIKAEVRKKNLAYLKWLHVCYCPHSLSEDVDVFSILAALPGLTGYI